MFWKKSQCSPRLHLFETVIIHFFVIYLFINYVIPIKLVGNFLSIFLSISLNSLNTSTLVTISVCNCNDILAETTKVIFSKQPVHSTQERFFKMYLQTPQNIQTLALTALSFLLDFTKPCRLLSTTHLLLKVTKKTAHFQPNIVLWERYRGYSRSHWAYWRRPPGSHEIWGPMCPKTKHHLCPRRIRTHTQNSSFDRGDLWDSKRQIKDWAGGRCYPALFRETLFLDQTWFNPRRHSY